jgi:MraZ protein
MFFGEFEYKVDEKGRVPIPPRFRDELKAGFTLVPGAEKCVIVYPVAEWEKLAGELTSSSVTPSKLRRLKRTIFAAAFSLEMDGQGRIALPPSLKKYAEIGDEVVIAGVNTYLELWQKAHWESERALSLGQAWQIIESLERRQ